MITLVKTIQHLPPRALLSGMLAALVAGWGTAAGAAVLIDETFDNDPDPLGGQPTNACCPGTWLPNHYTTGNVPDWEPMATSTDTVLRLEIYHDPVGGSQAANFAYINRGIGNPNALKLFNLDGFIETTHVVSSGQVIQATVTLRNIDGEQKFGLSRDIQAMADATASHVGPSPTNAMVVELVYGQDFSGRFLQAMDRNHKVIALQPEPDPGAGYLFPDGAHMADPLTFQITYTVGAETIEVRLNDMAVSVRDDNPSWGYSAGDPVPMRNANPPTQVDGMFFAGTRLGTDYLIDDIDLRVADAPLVIDNIDIVEGTALEFASLPGFAYELYRYLPPDPPSPGGWTFTGAAVAGTGDTLWLFDPAGFSTQSQYRVERVPGPPGPNDDPALVLRYTFDEDPGTTATDLSSYGHHGQITDGQYFAQLDGRDGVLRFNGTSSSIFCPDTNDLYFDGDLTFEMWVRRHSTADAQWAVLFGDGNNFDFYLRAWHQLILWYTTTDSLQGIESTVIPADAAMLSESWSHVAVVFEYPRCRFYHNGALTYDAYMPIPALVNRWRTPKKIGTECPIDLDEFRFYRRALSAAEIASHAAGQEAPPMPEDELAADVHWYEDTVTVRLSGKATDYSGHSAELTLVRDDNSEAVTPQTVPLAESFTGSGRYVADAVFPLAGLAGQSLDARARIYGPGAQLVRTLRVDADLEKPAWVDSPEGYRTDVPAPWTPLAAQTLGGGDVEVDVWGRTYEFGTTPFLQQVESAGSNLLVSAVTLEGEADGQPLAWAGGTVQLLSTASTGAVLRQTRSSTKLDLDVDVLIEYDGYAVFDCELTANQAMSLEELTLDIPLQAEHATLCFGDRVYPPDNEVPINEYYSAAVSNNLAFRFSQCIWLGDEERGMCWQAESDEDWHYADEQSAIEILPGGGTTTFRAHLVDVPTPLASGETLRYEFALLATPVRPLLRTAWDLHLARSEPYGKDLDLPDATTQGQPTLQAYVDAGIRHLFINVQDIWPWPMPATEVFSNALHRLMDDSHLYGLKIHDYVIHQRIPTHVPEFDVHGLYMGRRPLHQYTVDSSPPGTPRPGPVTTDYGAGSQGTVGFCPKSRAAQDAYLHSLAQRLDLFGDNGVYLDGTASSPPCRNTAHGCGYLDGGTLRPTFPVFAAREMMKRVYTIVKQRDPDGLIDAHCSFGYNPAALAYSDMIWTGEQWYHLRFTGGTDYVAGELTLDKFRTEFMGTPIGVAAQTLNYRLGPEIKVSATSLLHDIPVRGSCEPSLSDPFFDLTLKLWEIREEFEGITGQVEKHYYWDNQDVVTVSTQDCYATLLQHPANGVLAFITNLGTGNSTVTVDFDLAALGLAGQTLDVFNPVTGQNLLMSGGGEISVFLVSEEWLYVWVRPTD